MSPRIEPISPAEAFDAASYAPTFGTTGFRACRIHGPASLVRLVHRGRYSIMLESPGDYWMDATIFDGFLANARAEIANQGHDPYGPFPGLHARFQLRDALAVSKDWSDLDAYIEIHLPPGESLVVLVGKAAGQPYYSNQQPAEQARAESAGVRLPGDREQIVINFTYPANRGAVRFVRGPYSF